MQHSGHRLLCGLLSLQLTQPHIHTHCLPFYLISFLPMFPSQRSHACCCPLTSPLKHIFSKAVSVKVLFLYTQQSKSKLEKEARPDEWRQTDDRMKDRGNREEKRGGRGGRRTRYCLPTTVRRGVQLLGDHRGPQEQSKEKREATLASTPDLWNWVKRLETQSGSDNSPSTPPLTRISINTACYQQCCFTVCPAPHSDHTATAEVLIITLSQKKAKPIDLSGAQ